MKSKRAIRHLRENKVSSTILLYYAEQAIELAEEEAEDRAEKRIFEIQKLFVEVIKQKFGYMNALEVSAEVSKMLIDKLDNGGHSNE